MGGCLLEATFRELEGGELWRSPWMVFPIFSGEDLKQRTSNNFQLWGNPAGIRSRFLVCLKLASVSFHWPGPSICPKAIYPVVVFLAGQWLSRGTFLGIGLAVLLWIPYWIIPQPPETILSSIILMFRVVVSVFFFRASKRSIFRARLHGAAGALLIRAECVRVCPF